MGLFNKKYLFLFVFLWVVSLHIKAEAREFNLSLEQATKLAINNNFDIQILQHDAWIAQTEEKGSKSIFDTILRAEANYENDQSKKTTTIAGTRALTNDYSVGLTKKLPTGTTVDLDLINSRNATNSSFSTNPVTHDSSLEASITQELGRNFFGIKDRTEIKITKFNIENAQFTSIEAIEKKVAEVQKAYWDLVLAGTYVAIRQEMLVQAKRLYDLQQEQLRDGVVEMSEAIASEANYKNSKNNALLAVNQSASKENILKLQLNIDVEGASLKPTDNFILLDDEMLYTEMLKVAISNRYDYKKARNEIESKNLSIVMKKNSLWPEINLTATFAHNGLGQDFNESVENITDESNPNFSVGLNVSYPLENRKAKSEFKKAEYEKAQAILHLKKIEQVIASEIYDLVRDCRVLKEIALNDEEVAALQEQKLKEEEKKFNQGRSNTDTVIRFQEDALNAKAKAAESKYQYVAALIDLKLKQGILLDNYLD